MSDRDVKRLERELARQGREVFVVDKKKATQWWAAFGAGDRISAFYSARTRTEAINAVVGNLRHWTWPALKRAGWRAAKIRVFVEDEGEVT